MCYLGGAFNTLNDEYEWSDGTKIDMNFFATNQPNYNGRWIAMFDALYKKDSELWLNSRLYLDDHNGKELKVFMCEKFYRNWMY